MLGGTVQLNTDGNLYASEDNVLTWDEMRDITTALPVNDAVVSASIRDEDGVAVSGVAAVTLSYVSDSNGKYQGVLDATAAAALSPGTIYQVAVVATSGARDAYRVVEIVAQYHDEE